MATIQDIPSSEAPATSRTKINDNFGALNTELIAATSAVAGKAATVHTHATSDVTGLDSALSGKASTSHTHAISDTTGLQSALDGKQASGSYAASSHTHAISDTTGLQTALDGKQASGSYAASSHTHATSEVTGLDSALSGKAATSHSHATSDVTGLDSALSGKAATSHSHATSDVTGLDAALVGKAASSHNHAIASDITGLGTGIATALAVAVGSAGAPVVNGGALGTPSSGNVTGCTIFQATGFAGSDETTALTTGEKVSFRMPFAMTVTSVFACVTTAPTGSAIVFDVEKAGSSILSTLGQIEVSEFATNTSATPPVVSGGTQALVVGDHITIDLDQVGSTIAGTGFKLWFIGTK